MVGELPERTAAEQAERAIARTFVAARAGQLAFSTFMVIGDRRRYRRPKLQALLLLGTTVESIWLGRRILRVDRYQDRTGQWVDTAWSAFGLIACEMGPGPGGGAPWMKNIAIGAAIGAGGSGGFGGPPACSGCRGWRLDGGASCQGPRPHVAGLSLAVKNDIINWSGIHVAISTYIAAHRRQARLQDEADHMALENATKAAAELERSEQHRRVHRKTVEALRETPCCGNDQIATELARQEARRPRHILRDGLQPSDKSRWRPS